MYFSNEQLLQLEQGYEEIAGKHQNLFERYLTRQYNDPRAKEFAQHGFLRRIKTMARCIMNTFTLLPPERTALPSSEERHDAEINIQAFLFNTFAAADNLAWIWVSEKNVRKEDGGALPGGSVGLRKDRVRTSFSAEFQEYLQTLDAWFGHLGNFRHALAHRIPLYIPPYVVHHKDEAAYRDLETQMAQALKRSDFAEHKRLSAKQEGLALFRPWMQHSFVEEARHVVFHPQLLADFNTIDELGKKMLEELDR
jgi:hypothetical protein